MTAVGLGAGTVLALPPISFWPVLVLTLGGLYALWSRISAESRQNRQWFVLGWFFGVGFFAAGLYWVGHAFLVDAATFAWMIPFALIGLGAGLGLFTGLTLVLAGVLSRCPLSRWVGFACAWTAIEILRGWILTGFPWNLMGTVWADWPMMAQGASLFGVYGLSFVTVLASTAPVAGAFGAFGRWRWVAGAAVGTAILAGQAGFGLWRIPDVAVPEYPGVRLRLVQANIPQKDKWRADLRQDNLLQQVMLSRQSGWPQVTHVLWPETASTYPLDLDVDAFVRQIVAQAVPPQGWLIAGAPRRTPVGEPLRIWNSIVAINAAAQIGDVYDKVHLVPFGEYVPGGGWLPVAKLTAGRVDFTPGPRLRTVRLPQTPPYSPLVCYEVIFPGQVVDREDRPAWLLNLTNDGWFGQSAGPYQHFAAARLRAIEEGLSLVRVANTGISAVVDPYGQVVVQMALGVQGVVDSSLPQPLSAPVFARFGQLGVWGLILLAWIMSRCVGRHF